MSMKAQLLPQAVEQPDRHGMLLGGFMLNEQGNIGEHFVII